jgi:SAM-dependent methyltransferase
VPATSVRFVQRVDVDMITPIPPATRRDLEVCALCGALGHAVAKMQPSVTSEAKIVDAPSALGVCDACGHIFTRLEGLDPHDYYATRYDAALTDEGHDELVVTDKGTTAFRTDVDYAIFRRMCGRRLDASSTVFEYGCGRGRILSRLKKDGVTRLRAYDLAESYRAPVEALVGPGSLAIGDLPDPPPSSHRHIDVVCSFFVLEHDSDPLGALAYQRSLLANDGVLFAMVPNYETNLGDLGCADHTHHFSPTSLRRLFARVGLEVVELDDASAVGAMAVLARRSKPTRLAAEPRLTPDPDAATAPFLDYLGRLDAMLGALRPKEPVYLYGAGFYAALTLARLRARGHEATGIFDANPRKQGLARWGMSVAAPETATAREHGRSVLVVCVNRRVAAPVVDRFTPVFRAVLAA